MSDTPSKRRAPHGASATAPTTVGAHPTSSPAFDWRALVAQSQPGAANARQRAQAKRLQATTAELATWAEQFGLLTAYVKPSAMFAVVCTPTDAPDALTQSLARLILWYYSFDTALDSQPRGHSGDAVMVTAAIRACMAPMLADLLPNARLSASIPPTIARLSAALADWRAATLAILEHLAPHSFNREFWWLLLTERLTNALMTMGQELAWTRAWQANTLEKPPTATVYMQVASRTTGVHVTFALTCAGLGVAPYTLRERRPLLDVAARIIRLANDAATAEADLAARNLTAVTATLLRQPTMSASLTTQTEAQTTGATKPTNATGAAEWEGRAFARAQTQVKRRLDTAVNTFAQRLAQQSPGPDADYLRYTVAWALAHYAQP